MEFIKRDIYISNPKVYTRCLIFPRKTYKSVCEYGLASHEDLFSKVYELQFYSKKSYMFHEIVELVYLENRKAPPRPKGLFVELVEYLNSTGFSDENYSLAEFVAILFVSLENLSLSYSFGYASTDPAITDFIQSISSGAFSYKEICELGDKLDRHTRSVSKALQGGVPYNLMIQLLSKRRNSWIFNLCPMVFEDEKVGKLFLELSCHHDGPIPAETASIFTDLKHFLVKLPYLLDERIAMGKLVLLIYFPEYAQFIYDTHPTLAFKAILMKKLTKWRRDVAEKIDWKSNRMKEIPFIDCHFRLTKIYYDGYKENSMFDDFILMLNDIVLMINSPEQFQRQVGEIFVTKRVPENFFQSYKRNILGKEFQGTIYSIIRDKQNLRWNDYIDPTSKEVNLEFENEHINKLLTSSHSPNSLWFRSKYIDLISNNPVPISRITFDSRYSICSSVLDYCKAYREANVRVFHNIYNLLAHYCQPQERYQKKWDDDAQDCALARLFHAIWEQNINSCNIKKSFKIIVASLENDQLDFLTKRLLLHILKSVIEIHFSAKETLKIDFTSWTDALKKHLHTIINPSYKLGRKSTDKDTPPIKQSTNCIVT